MTDFVEQCRQEWKRLGVPDQLAGEMAADLSSDLTEAHAEGVSAEQLLGSSAHDPRSFAASWAAERGVIPERPSQRKAGRRPLALTTFTAIAAITLIAAALLLLTGNPKVTLHTSGGPSTHLHSQSVSSLPPGHVPPANLSAPVEWVLLFLALAALVFAGWLWLNRRSSHHPPTAPAA